MNKILFFQWIFLCLPMVGHSQVTNAFPRVPATLPAEAEKSFRVRMVSKCN